MMKQLGLIGYPLSHSFSKGYFKEKFQKEHIDGFDYELFPISSIDEFPNLIKNTPHLIGLNVTIPYKEVVIPYLDELDKTAAGVGAVNTIKITNGKLKGFNTDTYGFQQSLRPFLTSKHERALILGTGGASKAVVYTLKELGIDCLFASRNPKKENEIAYADVNENVIKYHKLIVNTTPLGMYPKVNEAPDIPYKEIGEEHLLYDLVYNPQETLFLSKGKAQGASIINGLEMLHLQAEKAWEIWNNHQL